jgi:heptosyltransferase-2
MNMLFDDRCHERLRRRPLGRYRYVRLRWRIVFSLVDLLGGALWRAARLVRRWFSYRGGAEAVNLASFQPERILLVQLDHLGDGLITTAMLPLLRRRWPMARIEVLASSSNRAVFESLSEVDRVHVAPVNRFARRWWLRLAWLPALVAWGLRLRRLGVDLAIDARGEFPLALLCWLSGARVRVGWNCGGGGFLLTHSARYVPDRPEIASRLALLAELGIRPAAGESWYRRFRPSPEARQRIAARRSEIQSGPLVVVHVGAGTPAKQWPPEKWRAVIAGLRGRCGARVVLVGGAAERSIAAAIRDGWSSLAVDWTGQLDLEELAALIEQADLFLGADSGPAHLAAAVGTPVVVLFSGTNQPEQWQPRGSRVVVVRQAVACSPCHRRACALSEHPCMTALDPTAVLTAAAWMLEGRCGRQSNTDRPIVTLAAIGAKP